jgi:phage terminase large subunit-like protein
VRMLRAPWNPTLRRELADFPYGQHDDIVDSASGGYNKLHRAPDPNQIAPSVSQRYVA